MAVPSSAPAAPAEAPTGLVLAISQTTSDEPAPPANVLATTTPLAAKDADKVLARLPALEADPAAQTTFAKRDTTLPVPKAGTKEQLPWPPKQTDEKKPPVVEVQPLTVRRYGPTGNVPIAADMSITFSQPMVAIGTVDQTKAQVPVKITPEPEGQWQWLGTETVVFKPKVRMPMATTYTVDVAKGTKSANGGALVEPLRFSFTTPAPTLTQRYPDRETSVRLDPVIFLGFEQRVNPKEMLASIKVDAGGSVAVRLATAAEIAADAYVSGMMGQCEPERCMAIVPEKPLAKATAVKVIVKKGAPSAEGPLQTTADQSFGFTTYGPFKITALSCWDDPCNPEHPLTLTLSNPLDAATFKDGMVHVDPAYTSEITAGGSAITIVGRKHSNTKYTVTVDAGMRDIFGQALDVGGKWSLKTGAVTSQLYLAREGFTTITPDNPRLDIMSAGQAKIHVTIYKVEPQHYSKYIDYLRHADSSEKATPPGTVVRDSDITVGGDTDDLVATALDLTPALTKGSGNAIIIARGMRRYRRELSNVSAWVQVTPLGLDAFSDDTDLHAWVTELKTGKPVEGATVELLPGKQTAKTNDDGVATVALPSSNAGGEVLVARHGDDHVILPPSNYYWDSGRWYKTTPSARTLMWMTDDRGMYKPGETAHFKGFVRQLTGGRKGELKSVGASELSFEIFDAQNNSIAKGASKMSQLGGFDFEAKFADNVNLGAAYVQLKMGDSYIGTHPFQIQEFRRPEFEVSASVNDGVHLIGEPQRATVKAAYYAGGALTGAPVRWRVVGSNANFTPPGREQFTFGIWEPWWRSYWGGRETLTTSVLKGTTDARGTHSIAIDPKSMKPNRATSIEAEASITDVNRQVWSAKATMLVHAASLYAGIKADRLFVEPGKKADFDLIAVDLDGKAVSGRDIRVTVKHEYTTISNGHASSSEVDDASAVVISADAPKRWTFTPKEGGLHHVSADVTDDKGRVNHTEVMLWVPGEARPDVDQVKHEELTLIPSAKELKPGDTLEVLVQAPFQEGEGLILVERLGVVSTTRLSVRNGSAVAKVKVTEELIPNFTVGIEVAGSASDPKTKKPRPTFASGHLELTVSSERYALRVGVTPASRGLSPGESTKVTVDVKDNTGKPVSGAEVTLIVVDEAVLALSGFSLSDPLAVMMPTRSADVNSVYLRDSVVIARQQEEQPPEAELAADKGGGAMDILAKPAMSIAPGAPAPAMRAHAKNKKEAAEQPDTPIAMRTDFSALAAFVPKLVTDGNGTATTTVKLPDNLTRYRVMAVAASAIQFGKGESTITARLPLMVRPSPPRFLNFGDSFDLPVVLQNQTEQALDIDVVARATNLELLTKGMRVHVAAGGRVEVRFPAKTVSAGTVRFQAGAVSGTYADAADQRLKVWTPATSEAFATYGVLDGSTTIVQPIDAPADVFPEAGGLTLSASSTALQSLTDAILYLVTYPFECSEQLSSRILTVVAMKDVLAAFEAPELPKPKEIANVVQHDLALLKTRQAGSGGFGFWDAHHVSPFASIHVLHALLRAKAAGFAVDAGMLERALTYARNVEQDMTDYPREIREVIVAYALMARARGGDVDLKKARDITGQGLKKVPTETLGFVLPVFHRGQDGKAVAEIVKELERRVTETAASAHFVTNYKDGAHLILASDRRSDAIVLGALMESQPTTDLIPKVARGLLDGRRKGHWSTTQENVFVLLALGDYFQQFEKQTPDFVARLWLGDGYAGDAEFHGREIVTRELVVPMKELVTAKKSLTVQKEGQGRMYYRIGLDYAPKSLDLAARDNGFKVDRTYEAVDDPTSVSRDADGVWHVKAGAKVRVKLTMVAPSVRYFVALVDPLPAGFEALNSALAVSESPDSENPDAAPNDDDDDTRSKRHAYWFWWRANWFDHENLRDERVEAFGSEVWAGVHNYTYVARATTLGHYVVPPTKAEEMYAPETFGRSASTRVIVE